MSEAVSYECSEGVATLTLDDGRVNALSAERLAELHRAFDRAEADGAVVVLGGREGIFSAGFDLKTLAGGDGPESMLEMLRLGATLCARILAFRFPVVTACTGHAYPAGAFLMLSADRRIGVSGDYRIGLNEVAIGLTLPLFAVEVARGRLTTPAFQRCTTGDLYSPSEAITAGFLDEVVAPEQLAKRAREVALGLTKIDYEAHYQTKLRLRAPIVAAVERAIDEELSA